MNESVKKAVRRGIELTEDPGDGVWKTIKGKKVFIKKGQSVEDAIQSYSTHAKAKIGKFKAEKIIPADKKENLPSEVEVENMTGEERANQVMKKYNADLSPNIFGDIRPKIRKGDKVWIRVKKEHEGLYGKK